MSLSKIGEVHQNLILDGTKINWYHDRVRAWEKGEKIAPITIDMALTQACNYKCVYCYAQLQQNTGKYKINSEHMTSFLNDVKEIGVQGISLVSDGESSISPCYEHTITYGHSLGLSMASGTNAYLLKEPLLRKILPCLTYLRVNITAGESERYKEIMGVKDGYFEQVIENIRTMMRLKKENGWNCTVGMQMVLMPEFMDQIIPLTELAISLEVDYLVIKHCSDDEMGSLGVNYDKYKDTYDLLKKAEACSNDVTLVKAKWSKITEGNIRPYNRCYGTPFLLQISGSGLVAPCGAFFNAKYKRYHIGNITEQSFKEIWQSDRYWEVINELASERFDAQTMCETLCLQHSVNKYLDNYKKGKVTLVDPQGEPPPHIHFV